MPVCCGGQAQIPPKVNPPWWLKLYHGAPIAALLGLLCPGGSQMPPIASLALTDTHRQPGVDSHPVWSAVGGRGGSQLLLCFCFHPAEIVLFTALLLRQMVACRAQGKWTDGLSSPQNYDQELADLACFLGWNQSKKLYRSFRSCFHLG